MSYDLHISKTEQWMDSKSNPITEKELIKVNHLLKGLPFIFEQGRLTLCGADSTVISLMIDIASQLHGYVQGDELEYYSDPNLFPPVVSSLLIDTADSTVALNEWVDAIKVGDTIHHVKFGLGQIESIIGKQQDKELIVRFSEKTKRILAHQASNKYHVVTSHT
ncbi:hypothetical protein PQ456_12115 [Paenibacillus kyungheensis]|uniref:Uncharacterized protein n=1 Tax=Paenibacillus kyungheensis TaxID=1452732 RepID=A0AAX3LWH6_9BACL|nr:hypothetical protein [Paenibacillus kyungheensis]WCT53955.1 hypothetical protein PQ456_12115 [Paenibacillus kyungheensis]